MTFLKETFANTIQLVSSADIDCLLSAYCINATSHYYSLFGKVALEKLRIVRKHLVFDATASGTPPQMYLSIAARCLDAEVRCECRYECIRV